MSRKRYRHRRPGPPAPTVPNRTPSQIRTLLIKTSCTDDALVNRLTALAQRGDEWPRDDPQLLRRVAGVEARLIRQIKNHEFHFDLDEIE